MSGQFLKEMGIPKPKYGLKLNFHTPAKQLSEMIDQIDEIISKELPEYLLCFGDTNSALAAALAALKNGIKVIHIEGGERNFDKQNNRVPTSSIPEEANRVIIDSISNIILCASQQAVRNLDSESVSAKYSFTGDITYDLYVKTFKEIHGVGILNKFNIKPHEYIFCTIHRALNTDDNQRLDGIITALGELDQKIVLPIHPRTQKMIKTFNLESKVKSFENIVIIDPVGYNESIILNANSNIVITDSGGVLREAYFNKIPSVLLDDTTEWIDLVKNNCCEIVGASTTGIVHAVNQKWNSNFEDNIFGDGTAVIQIIERIKEWTV